MNAALLPCGTAQVWSAGNPDLSCLDPLKVRQELMASGLLLLRGFETDRERFRRFAMQFSAQVITSPGEAKLADAEGSGVQLIVPEGSAQDLHQENGTLASRPDLLWFHCAAPAAQGGETTYADGVRIWQELGPDTRRLFLSRRIRYCDRVPRADWLTSDGFLEVRMHVGKLRLKGSVVRFDEDDNLVREYVTSAVGLSRWGRQPAFVNSLRGPYVHTVTFEDGSPIPDVVIEEIDSVHARLVRGVAWQAGDILVIDNTRCVHGRRAFRDLYRRHYTFMSLANF